MFNVDDQVDLTALLKANLAALGLDKYDLKKTQVNVDFLLPSVTGHTTVR
jgi:hypothetical protein